MATIEALYIFDEHKYVSSLAIAFNAHQHTLTRPQVTLYSTMYTPAGHLRLRHCFPSTCNSLHRALA